MKIYTKNGDFGETSLIGGKRVAKNSSQIEAYGNVDELISVIGNIKNFEISEETKKMLFFIQNKLFIIGTALALPEDYNNFNKLETNISEEDVKILEDKIDSLSLELPKLKSFIIPEGNFLISSCHLARTVCRRTERMMVYCQNFIKKNEISLKFVNRLSDYLFVLARKIAKDNNICEIFFDSK